ncbi:hypothetical protein [Phytohabitans rumicis]|uniref:WXG100 family type VII secretion target n=1 Tax=Phytohabitans rumicis TaxID=1076125 RepID=A0A6V8KUJ9_9ACTN|nr:hypothetical protein [Phytohabitans rumicis]GFJ88742.1 hypothetical protein Prum_023840 [Phytohabitans rumicis]
MGTYLNIDDDPNEVGGRGAILRSMATSFNSKAQAIAGEIETIEAEQPWGADSYGTAFYETYNVTPEGSEGPLREAIVDNLNEAGERLTKVGDGTILAMSEYQGTDDDNRNQINRTKIV